MNLADLIVRAAKSGKKLHLITKQSLADFARKFVMHRTLDGEFILMAVRGVKDGDGNYHSELTFKLFSPSKRFIHESKNFRSFGEWLRNFNNVEMAEFVQHLHPNTTDQAFPREDIASSINEYERAWVA